MYKFIRGAHGPHERRLKNKFVLTIFCEYGPETETFVIFSNFIITVKWPKAAIFPGIVGRQESVQYFKNLPRWTKKRRQKSGLYGRVL